MSLPETIPQLPIAATEGLVTASPMSSEALLRTLADQVASEEFLAEYVQEE